MNKLSLKIKSRFVKDRKNNFKIVKIEPVNIVDDFFNSIPGEFEDEKSDNS